MIRTGRTATRALVIGLLATAVAAGSAAAASGSVWMDVHARLAPVAGATATGRFSGVVLRQDVRSITPAGTIGIPRPSKWQLTWSLSLPQLDGPMSASLRIGSGGSSSRVTRVLCARCSTRTRGITALTGRQAKAISKADAVVVVRTPSARLRGAVKVQLHAPVRVER